MAENEKETGLDEMRDRYKAASEHAQELYDKAVEDQKFVFVPGNMWDEKTRQNRRNRPCYEFPKLKAHVRQVCNEMRQQRPSGKVRGLTDSDASLAELMNGICRNIESVSNAEQAYDIGFESAVSGGMGCWRITTDYASQDDFDLDIFIEPIRNFVSAKFDPASTKLDRSDADYAFVEEMISEDAFERRYPNADQTSFETADKTISDWKKGKEIRIAEYWYKEYMDRELWKLSNGETVYAEDVQDPNALTANNIQIVRKRTVKGHKVFCRLTNGVEWLTDPYEFPSKYIPIVPVWGNIVDINGVEHWQGMVRDGKDASRLHNSHKTAIAEAVAKAPKAPFILKPKWIKGFENMWKRMNADDLPYALISDDADEVPKRTQQAEVPTALITLSQMDNDDIKAATGIYDASLGERSNETSGRAIAARQNQGAVATFNYTDNLAYAIRHTYQILIDMIPKVYDTPRVVRIIGQDGAEKWKQLYQSVTDPQTGETVVLNDIRQGKYDVAVTVGPGYATQRLEAVDMFTQLAGQIGSSFPAIGPLLAYQVMKNIDLPGADEVSKALRRALVAQGLMQPDDNEPAPAPAPPDPRIQATVQHLMAKAAESEARARKTSAEADAVIPKAQAGIEADHADAAKTHAQAIHQHIQNLADSGALGQHIADQVHQALAVAGLPPINSPQFMHYQKGGPFLQPQP